MIEGLLSKTKGPSDRNHRSLAICPSGVGDRGRGRAAASDYVDRADLFLSKVQLSQNFGWCDRKASGDGNFTLDRGAFSLLREP
jgi:hypothetical protein